MREVKGSEFGDGRGVWEVREGVVKVRVGR